MDRECHSFVHIFTTKRGENRCHALPSIGTLNESLFGIELMLERLHADPALRKDLEFETKLRDLLGSCRMGLAEVIAILESDFKGVQAGAVNTERPTRRPREVKVYRNPLTGEIVESKGGNNKLLAAWKARFASFEVESWVQNGEALR